MLVNVRLTSVKDGYQLLDLPLPMELLTPLPTILITEMQQKQKT